MGFKLSIKVAPNSGKQACISDKSGGIKIFLKSPPVDGKANKELVDFLSKALKIPKNHIDIISGLGSRTKIIEIGGNITLDTFFDIMGLSRQLVIAPDKK